MQCTHVRFNAFLLIIVPFAPIKQFKTKSRPTKSIPSDSGPPPIDLYTSFNEANSVSPYVVNDI